MVEEGAEHARCGEGLLAFHTFCFVEKLVFELRIMGCGRSTPAAAGAYSLEQFTKASIEAQAQDDKQFDLCYDLSLLLHEDDTLTPEGRAVLNSVFERFDKDGDGAWSFPELAAYNAAINAPPLTKEATGWLTARFDIDMNGHLTRAGFFQLVVFNVHADPENLYQDLKALNLAHMIGRTEVPCVGNEEDVVPRSALVSVEEDRSTGRRVSVMAVAGPGGRSGGGGEATEESVEEVEAGHWLGETVGSSRRAMRCHCEANERGKSFKLITRHQVGKVDP
jgi:hypothetical protein